MQYFKNDFWSAAGYLLVLCDDSSSLYFFTVCLYFVVELCLQAVSFYYAYLLQSFSVDQMCIKSRRVYFYNETNWTICLTAWVEKAFCVHSILFRNHAGQTNVVQWWFETTLTCGCSSRLFAHVGQIHTFCALNAASVSWQTWEAASVKVWMKAVKNDVSLEHGLLRNRLWNVPAFCVSCAYPLFH